MSRCSQGKHVYGLPYIKHFFFFLAHIVENIFTDGGINYFRFSFNITALHSYIFETSFFTRLFHIFLFFQLSFPHLSTLSQFPVLLLCLHLLI